MEKQERYDAQTANILDSIFMSIPDSKPESLTEFDYCAFRYSIGLSKGAKLATPISSVIIALSVVQLMGMFTLAVSFGWTERHPLATRLLNLIYFTMTGNAMDTGTKPGPSLGVIYFCDLATFLIAVVFLYGMFQMHRRETISPMNQAIHVVCVVDIPNFLIVIFTRHLAKDLVDIMNGLSRFPALTVVSCILYVVLFCIRNLVWSTVYCSLFYKSGVLVSFSSYTYLNTAPLLYVALPTFGYGLCSAGSTNAVLIFSYIVAGIVCLYIGSSMTFMNKRTNGLVSVIGVMQLISAILTGITHAGYIDDPQLSFNITFWVSVLIGAVIMLGQGMYHRKYMNRLRICKGNFERLHIKRPQNFLFYMQEAAYEGIKFVADGSFLIWGLRRWQSSWFLCAVLRYACLIPDCPDLECLLGCLVSLKVGKNRLENFILYEYERVCNLRKVQASLVLMQDIKTVQRQMRQYEYLMKTFSDCLSNQDTSGYLYAGALMRIRRNMKTYIYGLLVEHPNCVEVLRLYGEFLRDIEKEEWIGTAYADLANSLERGTIRCINFEYLRLTAMFPRLQKAIPEKYSVRTRKSDNYESTMGDSEDPVRAPTGKQKGGVSVIMNLFVGLFLLAVLIYYIISADFWLEYSAQRLTKLDLEENIEFLVHVFAELSYRSICLLVDPGAFDFTVDYVLYLANELARRADGILEAYNTMTIRSPILAEVYKWVKDLNYMSGLDDSNASIRLDLSTSMNHLAERCALYFGNPVPPTTEEQSYYFSYIFSAFVFVQDALSKANASNLELKKVIADRRISALLKQMSMWLIFLVILIIIPIILYAQMKKLLKGCTQITTDDVATGPLVALLKRDHPTFCLSITWFYVALLFCVIVILLSHGVAYGYYQYITDEVINDAEFSIYVTRQHVALGAMIASVAGFDISPNNNFQRFKAYMLAIAQSFTVASSASWIPVEFSDNVFQIITLGIQQIGTDKLLYDVEKVNNMTRIMNETVAMGFHMLLEETWYQEELLVQEAAATELALLIIFSIIMSLVVGISGVCLLRLGKTLQMLRMMVNWRVARGIVKKGEKSEWRRNILDMMNSVAACLVSCDGWILMVNQQWCKVFELTVDMIIGKHIQQFITLEEAPEYIKSYDIGDDQSLYVIWMHEEDQNLRKELMKCTEDLKLARETIFPARFIDRDTGTESIGFVVHCSIYIMPVEFDEASLSSWCTRIEEIERYIIDSCAKYGHVDVSRTSGREITLIYGINEDEPVPEMTLLSCAVQVMELIRELSELDYIKGGADFAAVISLAKHAECVFFRRGNAVVYEMTGKSCWRQTMLRGYVEPNSVVLSRQVVRLLEKTVGSLPVEKLSPDVYIVRFAQATEPEIQE